jgi:hypothetical protein
MNVLFWKEKYFNMEWQFWWTRFIELGHAWGSVISVIIGSLASGKIARILKPGEKNTNTEK